MSNELDESLWLNQLGTVSGAILEMRATLSKLEDAREQLVRRLESSGVSRPELVRVSGLTRGRIWQMVQPVSGNEDGEIDPASLAELADWVDDLYRAAAYHWHEAGEVGTVDDYFPLEWNPRASL